VDVSQTIGYLFEDKLRIRLLQSSFAFDKSEEIPATRVLHDHEEMLTAFKDLEETNDVRVFDLLEEIDFLKHLALREIILHIRLLDSFDCYVLSCKLMYPKSDFTKSTLPNKLDELIVLECSRWQLIILLYVRLNELNKSVSLL
jgi:hypothetical protein